MTGSVKYTVMVVPLIEALATGFPASCVPQMMKDFPFIAEFVKLNDVVLAP